MSKYRIRESFYRDGNSVVKKYTIEQKILFWWTDSITVPTKNNGGSSSVRTTYDELERAESWLEKIIAMRDQKVVKEVMTK